MRLLLLAPPGAGKGTQGERLAAWSGVRHIAAGDLLREQARTQSGLGREIAGYQARGDLVPDQIVLDVLTPAVVEAAARLVPREDQDVFALDSHRKAVAASAAHKFDEELIPVKVTNAAPGSKAGKPFVTETEMTADEGPRPDTSAALLARLRPVFHAQGSVTAGNASQTSDGAAVAVLMDSRRAKELGLAPLARLVAYSVAGCLPEEMGIGPIHAVPKVLKQAGITLDDIGLIELNEAFAAQALAVIRALGLDPEKVNVNGGAIALGHPLGCTGAKLTATLLAEMKRRNIRYGMVTMCVGGGMGAAGIFELLS